MDGVVGVDSGGLCTGECRCGRRCRPVRCMSARQLSAHNTRAMSAPRAASDVNVGVKWRRRSGVEYGVSGGNVVSCTAAYVCTARAHGRRVMRRRRTEHANDVRRKYDVCRCNVSVVMYAMMYVRCRCRVTRCQMCGVSVDGDQCQRWCQRTARDTAAQRRVQLMYDGVGRR